MYSLAEWQELQEQLETVPQTVLRDSLACYIQFDFMLWDYLKVLCELSAGNPQEALTIVKRRIELVFGSDDLPGSLENEQQVPFHAIQELISLLLKHGFAEEAAEAAELSFKYAGNISQVHWPDTFIQDCFDPILSIWITAQAATGKSLEEISKQTKLLQQNDRFGIFVNLDELMGKFRSELS